MSLKPQSLRVGNSVFYGNVVDTIEEVCKDGHVFCEKNKYGIIGKEVNPILLDIHEIIELGFTKKINNIYYTEDEKYSIEYIDDEFVFFVRTLDYFGNNPEDLPITNVKFVHQLQNVFYFTTWEEITSLLQDKKYSFS